MKLSVDDEQTWMHKGYQAFTEVNFRTNSMMYFFISPDGVPHYLGANLDKKYTNEMIEHHMEKVKNFANPS
jgi:uncharacterized protein (DUF305 family)